VNSNRFALLAISLLVFASTGQTNSTPTATKTVKRATLVSPAATPAMLAAPDLSYIRPLRLGVKLGWQDSQPHKGSYRVTYGKFGESHHAHLIDVDSPPVEIGNLEAGTTYYFSVYFIDGITHRSSNYSNEQSLVVSPTGTEIAATATPSPIETATPSFTPYTRSTSSSAGGVAAGSVLVGGFSLWVILSTAFYFLPTIIAAARHHHNTGPIFVVNFFLGWTLIGWVCSLAWSFTTATVAPVTFIQQANGTFVPGPAATPKIPPHIATL
jgi:hypothetical protein